MTVPAVDKPGVQVNDIGKMVLLGLVIIVTAGLAAIGRVSETFLMSVLTVIVGYLIGNGVNALRGVPGSPALIARGATPAMVVGSAGNPVAVVRPEPEPGE